MRERYDEGRKTMENYIHVVMEVPPDGPTALFKPRFAASSRRYGTCERTDAGMSLV
jgi:hypothetical protein